jgi:hypothetical protein
MTLIPCTGLPVDRADVPSPVLNGGSPTVPDTNDPDDWNYWAKRITSTWQSSVANIIETGELLNEAKAKLHHGEFGDLIKRYLPFKQRTAQKLMKLARNPVLSKAAHVPRLPAHYGTLIALDTLALPDTELETKIHDGTITSKMERKDVSALKPKNAMPRESAMTKLKQTNIEQGRRILDLESELAHAKRNDGSLFGRGDSDKLIARILIETLGEDKAKKVAKVVLGQDKPKKAGAS